MSTILIVEGNTPDMVASGHSGAASFGPFIGAYDGLSHRLCNPFSASLGPLEDIAAFIFTGSGVPWPVDAPETAPQRAAMEAALATGLPVWGSCNGMQLGALVLGGGVGASPNGAEVGMALNLTPTAAGRTHPMMAGRAGRFVAPAIHRDEVQRLGTGTILIAGNAHSPIQAIAQDTGGVCFWGTQYHPELRPADIADFVCDRTMADVPDTLADDLRAAESDNAAAARLGCEPAEMHAAQFSVELRNWLATVQARVAGAAA